MGDIRSRPIVRRWTALALVAASLAIPASGTAYDGGGAAANPAKAPQFPTGNQVAEHRGTPPGAYLSTDAPAPDDGGNTVPIAIAGAVLLGGIGLGAVAMASRVRERRSPQPSV